MDKIGMSRYIVLRNGRMEMGSLLEKILQPVLSQWFIDCFHELPNHDLYGSPERSLKRYWIESHLGERYILDQIDPTIVARKMTIAENLERLHQINPALPIHPYLKNTQNQFISEEKAERWMLSRYLPHLPLDRRNYWKEAWRGKVMAEFLLSLHESSEQLPLSAMRSWDLPLDQYIPELIQTIRLYQADIYARIESIVQAIQPFLVSLPERPITFNHGDFHPLNILWGDKSIVGVIDWEFCGLKTRLYDIANMVGCLGMEKPEALLEKMTTGFIQTLYRNGYGSHEEWVRLIELMVAIRFGWLSEWFRKKDSEMVELEVTYMQFLLQYKAELLARWGIQQ